MTSFSLVIFCLSLFLTPLFATQSQDLQFLDSIKSKSFGKTILQSIQLQLKSNSKDSVARILTLLNQLKQQNLDSQAETQAAWDDKNKQCQTNIPQLEGEIAAHLKKIEENDNEVATLTSEIKKHEADLVTEQANLKTLEDALKAMQDQRKKEHEQYIENRNGVSRNVAALLQGKEIISKLLINEQPANGIFLEKPNMRVLTQMKETFKMMKVSGKFAGFIQAFVGMLNEEIFADQELVHKIINLIDELVDQLNNQLADMALQEKVSQETFDTEENNMKIKINNKNTDILDLNSKISNKRNQVNDLNNDSDNRKAAVENKTNQLNAEKKSCNDAEKYYNDTMTRLNEELDIIKKVINIFETRFENVRKYLTDGIF